jgi:hypothetical protein
VEAKKIYTYNTIEWLQCVISTMANQGRIDHGDHVSGLLLQIHAIYLKILNFGSDNILVHLKISQVEEIILCNPIKV